MNTVDITKIHNIIKEVYPSTSMGDWVLKEMMCVQVFEYAKNQMLDKACEWLKENIYNRVYKCGDDLGFPTAQFIEDFRKAMEE